MATRRQSRGRNGPLSAPKAFCAICVAVLLLVTAPGAQASLRAASRSCAQPDGRVSASTIRAGTVYVGGSFTHVTDRQGRSQPRAGLAAIDTTTCRLLPWTADTNGDVYALEAAQGILYVGGDFTKVRGKRRLHLAAVNLASGTVNTFDPRPDRPVRALAASGARLYVGGSFTKVGRASRSRLAAFKLSTRRLDRGWKPAASGTVLTLSDAPRRKRIYVGGSFRDLNARPARRYLGAVDPVRGHVVRRFDPRVAFPILSVSADTRGVYAGGGGHGGHLAVWNGNGSLQRPVYQTDGGVQAVAVEGNSLYAGGHFTNYCVGNSGAGSPFRCDKAKPRRKLLEVSLSTGRLTKWAPTLDSPRGVFTESVAPATGDLWVGGDFTTINAMKQAHVGTFPAR